MCQHVIIAEFVYYTDEFRQSLLRFSCTTLKGPFLRNENTPSALSDTIETCSNKVGCLILDCLFQRPTAQWLFN